MSSSRSMQRYKEIAGLLWKHRSVDLRDPEGATSERARALVDDLERLGPTFVKLGQVLGSRPDLVAPPYIEALQRLQDRVAPFDVATLEAIVSAELGGVRLKKAFSSFSEKPLAAASLGQVHRAALRDGRQVVVKVQRPGVREQVHEDLQALAAVARLLEKTTRTGRSYELSTMVDELKGSLERELDYEAEAGNLRLLRERLLAFPRLAVPRPIDAYTTSRVLTMEYFAGSKITALSPVAFTDIDGPRLAEELLHAYLQQILVDGWFHADPHPGNVLLLPDGRLALIDLGMVAWLSPAWRDGLFRLLLALSEGRSDEVADVSLELSDVRDDFDERSFRRQVTRIVARQQHAAAEDVEVGTLVMEISSAALSSGLRVPSELTMLGKALLHLDHIARTLAPQLEPNQAIRDHAQELMGQRLRQQVSAAHMFGKALEMNDLAQRLPTLLSRLLDAVARNRFKLKVDALDEDVLIEGLQKVANRITAGLVLAALIIGSSLMMKVETSFRLLGYPGFAILFFLLASAGAMFLVVDVFWKDRKFWRF